MTGPGLQRGSEESPKTEYDVETVEFGVVYPCVALLCMHWLRLRTYVVPVGRWAWLQGQQRQRFNDDDPTCFGVGRYRSVQYVLEILPFDASLMAH